MIKLPHEYCKRWRCKVIAWPAAIAISVLAFTQEKFYGGYYGEMGKLKASREANDVKPENKRENIKNAYIGEEYIYQPDVDNPDGVKIENFLILNLPDWASFDKKSGKFYGTPKEKDIGYWMEISIGIEYYCREGSYSKNSNHTPNIVCIMDFLDKIGDPCTKKRYFRSKNFTTKNRTFFESSWKNNKPFELFYAKVIKLLRIKNLGTPYLFPLCMNLCKILNLRTPYLFPLWL